MALTPKTVPPRSHKNFGFSPSEKGASAKTKSKTENALKRITWFFFTLVTIIKTEKGAS